MRDMSAPLAKVIEGKKYMWDGQVYDSRDAANTAVSAYRNDGFDIHLWEDQEKFFVYTRRVAKVVVVEGQA